MKLLLLELFIAIWELLCRLKDTVVGVFYIGHAIGRDKKNKELLDVHHYYKEKTKRKMLVYISRERLRKKKILSGKAIIPRLKENYAIANYVITVLVQLRPQGTIQSALQESYDYIHPYLMSYYSVWWELREAAKDKDFAKRYPLLVRRANAAPDLLEIACEAMAFRKKLALLIKGKEMEMRKIKLSNDEIRDSELIDDELDRISQNMKEMKEMKLQLEAAKKKEKGKQAAMIDGVTSSPPPPKKK